MQFRITNIVWDVDDIMEEDGISYEDACDQQNLPTDYFTIDIPYEIADPANGPTDEEMQEIDDELADAISDEYGFCIYEFSWDNG